MAFYLLGTKPFHEQMLTDHQFDKCQWNLNQNMKHLFQENVFENVFCKMAAILFKPRCDKEAILPILGSMMSH